LWGIAQPHFHYPPLKDSMWNLPMVRAWGPAEDNPDGTRFERRIAGKPVVPTLVLFPCDPGIFSAGNSREQFKLHLQQRTDAKWMIDWTQLARNVVVAQRLGDSFSYTDVTGEIWSRTRLAIEPRQKPTRVPRQFWRSLWRGLKGGWDET
jgi:hypothetical protein